MRTKKFKKDWNINEPESRLAGCTGAAVMLVSKQNNPMSDEILDIVAADRKFTSEKVGRTRLQLTYAIDGADSQCQKCKQWIACRSQLARHRAYCNDKSLSDWKYKFARNGQGDLFCYFGCGTYALKIDLLIHLQQAHTSSELRCFGISDTALTLCIFKLQEFDPCNRSSSLGVQSIDNLVELAASKDISDYNKELDWLDVGSVKPSLTPTNLTSKVTNLARNKKTVAGQCIKCHGNDIKDERTHQTIQHDSDQQGSSKETSIYNADTLGNDGKPSATSFEKILQDAHINYMKQIANEPPKSFQTVIETSDEGVQIYGDWYMNCILWASMTDPSCAERLLKEIKCVSQLMQERDTHPLKKYLPLKVKVWKTLKHITLAYELPSDSRTMRNITLEEGAENALKVIERLKDDLPNIHTVAACMGDLTVTSIYYDSNTQRITFVDWSNYQAKMQVQTLSIAGQQVSNGMFVSYPATGLQDKWRILWLMADCLSLKHLQPNEPLPSQSHTDNTLRHTWAMQKSKLGYIHHDDQRISFEMLLCRAVDSSEDQVLFAYNIELAWQFIDFNQAYEFSNFEKRTVVYQTPQHTDNNEHSNDIMKKRDEKFVTKTISWSNDTEDYRDKLKYYHLRREIMKSKKRMQKKNQANTTGLPPCIKH